MSGKNRLIMCRAHLKNREKNSFSPCAVSINKEGRPKRAYPFLSLRYLSQSLLNWSIPLEVRGCSNIILSTLKGTVA